MSDLIRMSRRRLLASGGKAAVFVAAAGIAPQFIRPGRGEVIGRSSPVAKTTGEVARCGDATRRRRRNAPVSESEALRPLHHALCGARSPSRRFAGEVRAALP